MDKDNAQAICRKGNVKMAHWIKNLPALGGANGNPLQYSCLEDPMDREAWQAIVHGVTQSQTRLITYACHVIRVWFGNQIQHKCECPVLFSFSKCSRT